MGYKREVRIMSMVDPATMAAISNSESGMSFMTLGGGTKLEGNQSGSRSACFF